MHIFKFSSLAILFAAVGWGAAAHAGGPAMTKNFFATVAFDAPDAHLGDGECNISPDPNGPKICTLRAAIMQGNTYGEDWEVNVTLIPEMVYVLSIAGEGENSAAKGDLDILRPMRIGVPASASGKATIDANQLDRAFHFLDIVGRSEIFGVTITGGAASSGIGAAIYSRAEKLLVDLSNIDGNNIPELGGASVLEIDKGQLVLRDSSISYNGDHLQTRGLNLRGAGVEGIVERSVIAGNAGSGVWVTSGARLEMLSSTVSGNGFYGVSVGYDGEASIRSSTIVANSNAGVRAYAENGHSATVGLRNSIVTVEAEEDKACAFDEDDEQVIITTESNIYSDDTCFSDVLIDGSLHNTPPLLSELGSWGGPTLTHIPLPGSPAIDNAAGVLCEADMVDQRGMPRPVAHKGNVEPRCDTGAVELEALVEPEDPWVPEIFLDGFEDEG